MRKYRINVKTRADGKKKYYPQYKRFGIWRYFSDYDEAWWTFERECALKKIQSHKQEEQSRIDYKANRKIIKTEIEEIEN